MKSFHACYPHAKFWLSSILISILLALTACSPQPAVPATQPVETQTVSASIATFQPSSTLTATALPATPTPEFILSSPLQSIQISELESILTNPFEMPHPQWDDGHHGADFAFYSRGELASILGLQIQSVLAGTVAAILEDRPPYGNMIIVETPLSQVPAELQAAVGLPTPAPTVVSDGRLTCPESGQLPDWEMSNRSLYLLYAHMQAPTKLKVGDKVQSGQIIGYVGTTGHSSNPHLHLEVRIGPAQTRFHGLIAHKDGRATLQEMYNYCLWRISNAFQLIDPMLLLKAASGS